MTDLNTNFFNLTPDEIFQAVENALNQRATGRLQALNSIENRVYQIELEDESNVVAKFYRPNRWSKAQIEDEHFFIKKLAEEEIPVVAPFSFGSDGSSLGQTSSGIYFVVFPRLRARMLDEPSANELRHLGRFLARIHNVGESLSQKRKLNRLKITTQTHAEKPLELLLSSPFMAENMKKRYSSLVESLIKNIAPLINSAPSFLIHGDCHLGNVLWTHGTRAHETLGAQGQPYFVDFDDCMIGPPIQDLWMVTRETESLLEGYETMRTFDHSSIQLKEPLRALRMIHYSGWIAKRWDDPSFPKMFPTFGTEKYWQEELEQLERVLNSL